MSAILTFDVLEHQTAGLQPDGEGGVLVPFDAVWSASAWISRSDGPFGIEIRVVAPDDTFETVAFSDTETTNIYLAVNVAFFAALGSRIQVWADESFSGNTGGSLSVHFVSRPDQNPPNQPSSD